MNRIASTCQPGISRDPDPEPSRGAGELAPLPTLQPEPLHEIKSNPQDETTCTSKPCPKPAAVIPSDKPTHPSESVEPPEPRVGDHLLKSPITRDGPPMWRPPWERVLRDIQCRIHLGEEFCSHMKDARSGMIGYQYHPSRDIVTKNRHTFHDLLNLYSLLRLYDHEMKCQPMDDIPEPKRTTHGTIWKMIMRGVWYYWEMITPIPIRKHQQDQVAGEGFDHETEHDKGSDDHMHRLPTPPNHPAGCSPPLYLCPRRLTRSSHIGHSGMYVLVLCLWHCLHRDYGIDEDPSNKIQRMDAIQGLVQGILKLQRHSGSYKVYFDRFHHTDEGMETYSGVAMYALTMAQQVWEDEMKRTSPPQQIEKTEEEKKQSSPSPNNEQKSIISVDDQKQCDINQSDNIKQDNSPTIITVPVPIPVPVPVPVRVIVCTSSQGTASVPLPDGHDTESTGAHVAGVIPVTPNTLSEIQEHLMKQEDTDELLDKLCITSNQTQQQQQQQQPQQQENNRHREMNKEKEKDEEKEPEPNNTRTSPNSSPQHDYNNRAPRRFMQPRASPPQSREQELCCRKLKEWEKIKHQHELDYHSEHPIHGDFTAYSTKDVWHPCGWESPAVEYDISHLLYTCEIDPIIWQTSVEKAVLAYIMYVQNGYVEDEYRVVYACWHSRACASLVHHTLKTIKPEVVIAYVWGINDRIINSGWYDGIIDFAESMTSIEVAYGLCGVIEAYMLLPSQPPYDDEDMHKRRAHYLQCIATCYAFLAMTQRTHDCSVSCSDFTARSIGGLVQALQLPLMRIDCTGLMIQAFTRLESAIGARQSEFDESFVTQLEAVITHVIM